MINEISVDKLNKLSKKKKIWCIGCGKRLYELNDLYMQEKFIKHVDVLLDNDKHLWGKTQNIGNKTLIIENPYKLYKNKMEIVLLITSDHYNEIFESVKKYIENQKVTVYRYPQVYSKWTNILFRIAGCFPMKRQLLFYAGKEPHDNADEIVRYLNSTYSKKMYTVIYLEDENHCNINGIKFLNKWTIRKKSSFIKLFIYCFMYSRSKYLLYENEALTKVNNKQKLIYLNHGTIPLKNVSDVLKQPESVDYATCPGEGCADLYEKQYGIIKSKNIYMMPARVNHMLECKGKLHNICNAENKQIILWLPTFRQLVQSSRKDSKIVDPILLLRENFEYVHDFLKRNNQIIAIKKHPREKIDLEIPPNSTNIIVLSEKILNSEGVCLQELLKDADALLTDYSGISFEYMLLDKPIGYVLYDIQSYYRGFSVENIDEYMPGKKIKDISDLICFLKFVKQNKDDFKIDRKLLVNKLFDKHAYKNGAKELIDFLDKEEQNGRKNTYRTKRVSVKRL